MTDEIIYASARDLAARLRNGDLSAVEVMDAFLARIAVVNPDVNAICTLEETLARDGAAAADEARIRGDALGPLHGLPIAIKDLAETAGIRTTMGSPLFADNVPNVDQVFVARLKQAGAIIIGKTNTPEFGAGSQTFNPIFGPTRNPFDLSKTVGGSSGGAAAALASGMAPLADGSDFGGSLRNPAGYCNVVGFRCSPGRVPKHPARTLYNTMSVTGPMARDVEDAALMLSVMAGPDPRDPLSIESPGSIFAADLEMDCRDERIAISADLGYLPVDPAVRKNVAETAATFSSLGCEVESAFPDLADAEEIFHVIRANSFALGFGGLYKNVKESLKDTIQWNVEQGLALTTDDLNKAQIKQEALYHHVRRFFDEYDFLILPSAQLPPFSVDVDWPREIDGVQLDTYLKWMQVCCVVTVTGLPVISIPAGFTDEGLPLGIQIVGRWHDDLGVLKVARAFERATEYGRRRPAF
jgi:amidase